jgi:cell division protease FtsH
MRLPDEDRTLMHKSKFEDEIAARMGGRAAEELTFGDVTTGVSDDLERATKAARAMVTQYGMSDCLGPITFGEKDELIFLGREIGEQRNYSEAVAEKIDREVQRIVHEAYRRAKSILTAQRDTLHALAQTLLEKETVDAQEFEQLYSRAPAAA